MGQDESCRIHDKLDFVLGLHVLGLCVLGCLTIHVHLTRE